MNQILAYFRNLCRALLGADSAILAELSQIKQELHAMSANSDRLAASFETLTATVNNIVLPALSGTSTASADAEVALGAAADQVDALNGQIIAAHTTAPAPVAEPTPVVTDPAATA